MTDREMLELAAKAAGTVVEFTNNRPVTFIDGDTVHQAWNPLEDDGDAFRLAVRLGIDLLFTTEDVEAVATMYALQEDQEMISPWAMESWTLKNQDPGSATRRAIVRAAAEVGRNMK